MPLAPVNGIELHYEVTGAGEPLVFSHEFGGDFRSWEPQVRFFARRYQVITYNHRGYPPSTVPDDPATYTQEHLIADLLGLLDHLGITQAHLAGLSMGGNVVLNFALAHPDRCRSIVVAGTGSGSDNPDRYRREGERLIALLNQGDMPAFADAFGRGPTRLQLLRKDPRGWQEFRDQLAEHSARGSAMVFAGVPLRRPTIYQLAPKLDALTVPTLLVVGDEDGECLAPALFIKQHVRTSGLLILPNTGHLVNLEEPDLFNQQILDFLTAVEGGHWPARDPGFTTEVLF